MSLFHSVAASRIKNFLNAMSPDDVRDILTEALQHLSNDQLVQLAEATKAELTRRWPMRR